MSEANRNGWGVDQVRSQHHLTPEENEQRHADQQARKQAHQLKVWSWLQKHDPHYWQTIVAEQQRKARVAARRAENQ